MCRRATKGLFAAFFLLALLLASCGSTEGTASNGVTLTYWTHTNAPANKLEQKLITQYEKLHPNVKVNYLNVDIANLPTKLTTALASGSGPDIFNYFQSYVPALAQRGLVAPVDYGAFGTKDKTTFDALYPASILNGYAYNGTAYGIPHEVSSYVYWINTAQFKAAGLDPVKDFPKTWEEVEKIGKMLTITKSGRTTQEGIELNINTAGVLNFDAMARQAGQSLFSEDGKKAYLNSPAAIKALQTWTNYARVSKIYDPALNPAGSGADVFGNGSASMSVFGGSWEVSGLQQSYPNVYKTYSVGAWPTFAGGKDSGANLYGFGLYVAQSSEHQQEAWKFARFLTDNSAAYFSEAGLWLGDNATLNGTATKDFPHWAEFSAAFKRGSFFPPLIHYSEIANVIQQALQRSILNGQSVEASLNQAQSEVQQYL